MTITIFFNVEGTASQYDQVMRDLAAANASAPAGRLYHVAQPDSSQWSVVDVWESTAAFEKFAQTLVPILQKNGLKLTSQKILPTHNIVRGG
jgi:hypothetical protein